MSKLTTAYELIHAAMRDDEFTSDELIKLDHAMVLIEKVEDKASRKLQNAASELDKAYALSDKEILRGVFDVAFALEKLREDLE